MQDFTIKVPTQIIFGRDKENQIGEVLKANKIKKVLMVYGSSSIKKYGLYNRVVDSIEKSKVELVEYAGIKSNPRISDVDKAGLIDPTVQRVDNLILKDAMKKDKRNETKY